MGEHESYPHLLRRADIVQGESTYSHPWNPKSEITGTHLSGLAGLQRTGVSIVRLAPGKESFAYHLHHREEEWIYIIAGKGVARVDGRDYEMGAGDFIAFPTPSVPHILTNPGDDDLVCLMGGEYKEYEIADFPELGKRMIRRGTDIEIYRLADGEPFDHPDAS